MLLLKLYKIRVYVQQQKRKYKLKLKLFKHLQTKQPIQNKTREVIYSETIASNMLRNNMQWKSSRRYFNLI
jgi:hypothetical protein